MTISDGISKRKTRWPRFSLRTFLIMVVAIGIAAVAIFFLISKAIEDPANPYVRFKREVESNIDYADLQNWAMDFANDHEPGRYKRDVLPEQIKHVPGIVFVIVEEEDGIKFLYLACGGGFGHWALIIGPPNSSPPYFNFGNHEKIKSGIWGNWE